MKLRTLLFAFVLSFAYRAFGHDEGPPPTGVTVTSLLLTSGGAVIVTLTLLAILWKPIDAAFRLSQFRARWELRSTRIIFALGSIILAAVVVGAITYVATRNFHTESTAHDTGAPEPENGGVMKVVGRFGLELILHRTGEVRLYITVLNGDKPSSWDIKASVSPTKGFYSGTSTNAVPLKLNANSEYFVTVIPVPEKSEATLHLSLNIKKEPFEVDFDMPVQD